jgi:cytochrome P450
MVAALGAKMHAVALTYDPLDDAFLADPYDFYRTLRAEAPVHRDPGTGAYLVSRFEDILRVTTDWRTFSSEPLTGSRDHFASMDPPRHDVHRAKVARLFTPRAIAKVEALVRSLTIELLHPLVASGPFDLAAQFAAVLPCRVISRLVGVPHELEGRFRDTALEIGRTAGTDAMFPLMTELEQLTERLVSGEFEVRPGTILERLVDKSDGEELSRDELVGLCTNLVLAGTDTTANLIATAAVLLAERPVLRDALAADPSGLPAMLEETLRFESPVQWLARRATRTVTLHGIDIPVDATLRLLWGSANRDEREFDDPDTFVPGRRIARHLAFGYGLHYCVGAALARLEARVALEELLACAPLYGVDTAGLVRLRSSTFRGWEHVPVHPR